jgi:membrane associated rhomboid family serine protease
MKARGAAWLLAALLASFAAELLVSAPGNPPALYALGALPDDRSLQREWWRLLCYGFLHWGWAHFIANFALIAWVAPVLERRVGAWRLWTVFLVAVATSGLAIVCKHAWWPAPGVTVGASGGAFALLVAATVILWREPGAAPRARFGLLAVLAGGTLLSFWPGVSLLGHAVGAMIGAGFAAIQSPTTNSPLSTPRVAAGPPVGQDCTPSKYEGSPSDCSVGPSCSWKCRCGNIALPEAPMRASASPRCTRAPTFGSTLPCCRCA